MMIFKMSRTDAYLFLFLLKQLVWKANFGMDVKK